MCDHLVGIQKGFEDEGMKTVQISDIKADRWFAYGGCCDINFMFCPHCGEKLRDEEEGPLNKEIQALLEKI